jgi:hypothetical protein
MLHIRRQTMHRHLIPFLALVLFETGCASGPPFVDRLEPKALGMAERRGAFELACPEAKGQVLNKQELEPMLFGGPVRARYTVGISGCDKHVVVEVMCSENNDQCIEGH